VPTGAHVASLDKSPVFRQWRRDPSSTERRSLGQTARIGFAHVVRKILFATLALAPLTIALHYFADLPETTEFVLAALALIPLAWLIGEATEHAAEHTGPGIGGFLNATFGNAPELIIALIAVNEGLTEVVRGSLSGSVVSNLLLVLGAALVAGGLGELDRHSSFVSFGLLALATVLFLVPSIPGWDGDPDRHALEVVTVPVSIVLLVVYLGVTWYSLRRHSALHIASDEEIRGWSLRRSLLALAITTAVTALVAEILVGSLEVFADKAGLSEFFVAAVIVAIVGNAAEHGGAVIVAFRGKIALAGEIALSSAAQVAVFLIPAVALLSWLLDPLSLSFRPVEIAALAGSVVYTALVLFDGRSTRFRGGLLLVGYAVIVVAFFLAGDR
jgi:Ca2+:H+ antiporter